MNQMKGAKLAICLCVSTLLCVFSCSTMALASDDEAIITTLLAGMANNQSLITDAKIMCSFETTQHNKKGECVFWFKGENFRIDETSTYEIPLHSDPSTIVKAANNETYYHSPSGMQELDRTVGALHIYSDAEIPTVFPLRYGTGIFPYLSQRKIGTMASKLRERLEAGNLRLIGQETIGQEQCYILEMSLNEWNLARKWICPAKGYTILKEQVLVKPMPENPDGFDKEVLEAELNCTVMKHGQIWSLARMESAEYRPTAPGELPMKLYRKKTIVVSSSQFNIGLQDSDLEPRADEYRYAVMGKELLRNPLYIKNTH